MHDLFATAGMSTMTVVILLIEAMSLAMMLAVIVAFRRVRASQRNLLLTLQSHLRNPALDALLQRVTVGRFLRTRWGFLWLYILATLATTLVTLWLFLFQPHLL